MVNNADVETRTSVLDTTEAQYDEVMAINLKSAFFGTQIAAPGRAEEIAARRIIILFSLTAIKQEMGCRARAISVSLAQPSEKFSRTQMVTLCFSGAKARRIWICCSFNRLKAGRELGRS
jgi:NAD(P)-dependent dehydrogenase (short-subunit alcohol dehydrogenase family)